jgi:hypothetical protein
MTDLSHYRRTLAGMTTAELLGEAEKLKRVLSNLDQANSDRLETRALVCRQLEEVRTELSLSYIEKVESESKEEDEDLF